MKNFKIYKTKTGKYTLTENEGIRTTRGEDN